MAEESRLRRHQYNTHGCNIVNSNRPVSKPMSFWVENDIYDYIDLHKLNISKAYTEKGYCRTGCAFCMFGIMHDKNRFIMLKENYPKLYKYCINDLGLNDVLSYMNIEYDKINLEDFY